MSKRVLVFGGSGMLGKRVVSALHRAGHMVAYPTHSSVPIFDFIRVDMAMADAALIINCAGAIAGPRYQDEDMIEINAVGPHVIARAARHRGGIPVIHISTDCVFSGVPRVRDRRYQAHDRPYPRDLYGKTKALGEVDAPHVTNVRTSFIGPEHGLMAWFISRTMEGGSEIQTVEGWQRAFWTGSTAEAVADALAAMADEPPGGIVHLATRERLSKYEVLLMLREHLGLKVEIKPEQWTEIDRSLQPTVVLTSLRDGLAALKVPEAVTA